MDRNDRTREHTQAECGRADMSQRDPSADGKSANSTRAILSHMSLSRPVPTKEERYSREAYEQEEGPLLAALPRFELLKRLSILRDHESVKKQLVSVFTRMGVDPFTFNDDEILKLEEYFLRKKQEGFERQYGERGPFRRTSPERIFAEYAGSKFSDGTLLFKGAEAIDPLSHGVLVGPSALDVLLLGWAAPGYDAVAFEINGGIHELKHAKDRIREYWLPQVLGILVIPISNHLVHKGSAAEGCGDFNRIYVDKVFLALQPVSEEKTRELRLKVALLNIAVHGGSLATLEQTIERVLGRKVPLSALWKIIKRIFRPKWARKHRTFDGFLREHRKKRKFSRCRERLALNEVFSEAPQKIEDQREPA